jgi:hypothetical protein
MKDALTLHTCALFSLYFLHKCNSKTDVIKDYVPVVNVSQYSLYITLAPILLMLYSSLDKDSYMHILVMITYSLLYNRIITALTPEDYTKSFFPVTISIILSLIYNQKMNVVIGYSYLLATAFFILSNDEASTSQLSHDLLLVHFLFFVSKN